MASWARLKFQARKIQEPVLTENTFSIQGSEIPTIQEQGIRCLGMIYDSFLKDRSNLKDTIAHLNTWLKAIDNSHLLGRFKVWYFQHGIIPRLQWPFLIYDFSTTQVEAMEGLCSKFVQKVVGRSPSFQLSQLVQQNL